MTTPDTPALPDWPIGTPVRYWRGLRTGMGEVSRTRSLPWLLGSARPVVAVEGTSGGIALTHIELLTEDDYWVEFGGCSRECRKGAHTLVWAECEHGVVEPPPPGPVLPVVFLATDGHRSLRYDDITWEQAEEMLRPSGTTTDELVNAHVFESPSSGLPSQRWTAPTSSRCVSVMSTSMTRRS